MTKRDNSNRPRHLRAATPGETSPDAADTREDAVQSAVDEFKAQACNIIDACEQVIIIGCAGGVAVAVLAMNPDRHAVMGALSDALDLTTYPPGCDCDD